MALRMKYDRHRFNQNFKQLRFAECVRLKQRKKYRGWSRGYQEYAIEQKNKNLSNAHGILQLPT